MHYWVTINISCWLLFLATYRWTSPNGPCYSWLGQWYENWCRIWCRKSQMVESECRSEALSLIITPYILVKVCVSYCIENRHRLGWDFSLIFWQTHVPGGIWSIHERPVRPRRVYISMSDSWIRTDQVSVLTRGVSIKSTRAFSRPHSCFSDFSSVLSGITVIFLRIREEAVKPTLVVDSGNVNCIQQNHDPGRQLSGWMAQSCLTHLGEYSSIYEYGWKVNYLSMNFFHDPLVF